MDKYKNESKEMIRPEISFPARPEKPADNLKFTAYKKIVDSFEEAEALIAKKNPVLGEPIVVPFYHTSAEGKPPTVELAFGIGTPDSDRPYITSSINKFIGDEILVPDDDSLTGYISLKEKLNKLPGEISDKVIDDLLKNQEFLSQMSKVLVDQSDAINAAIEQKINENFVWKSLSSLIDK